MSPAPRPEAARTLAEGGVGDPKDLQHDSPFTHDIQYGYTHFFLPLQTTTANAP